MPKCDIRHTIRYVDNSGREVDSSSVAATYAPVGVGGSRCLTHGIEVANQAATTTVGDRCWIGQLEDKFDALEQRITTTQSTTTADRVLSIIKNLPRTMSTYVYGPSVEDADGTMRTTMKKTGEVNISNMLGRMEIIAYGVARGWTDKDIIQRAFPEIAEDRRTKD